MQKILLTFLLVAVTGSTLRAQTSLPAWNWLNPMPQGAEPMYDIHMVNEQLIVAAGRDGHVMHSADGGQNWSVQKATDQKLLALDFGDALQGWACGPSGTLIKTNDGGITWTPQSVPGSFDFMEVDFADAQNGWLAGPGVILKTSNGGSTWQNVTPMAFISATGIHFINAQEGWFCGTVGTIMHTTNGGTTWTSQTSNTSNELRDIRFLNNQTGWACGAGGTIVKTSDGGNTWVVQSSATELSNLQSIVIFDSQIALIAGENSKLFRTANGGTSWSSVFPTQSNMDFYQLHNAGNKLIYTLAPTDGFPGTGRMAISNDQGFTWQELNTTIAPARCVFRDVIIRSPQEWWAIGNSIDSGYVFKTTNAGQSWSKKVFSKGLNTGQMLNSSTGWVAGVNNQIYKTTTSGNSWITQNPGNLTADYYDLQILNEQTVWIAGYSDDDEGVVIKSTNGGVSWTNTTGIANDAINAIHFTDEQKGWAVGNGGVIRKTNDGGSTWTNVAIEFESGQLKTVFFTSASTGYIAGENGRSYKTTDGGQNWTPAGLGGFKGLYYNKILFVNPDTGFAIRNDGKIKTINAASSWSEFSITPARELNSIAMLNGNTGIIGGESATLLGSSGLINTGVQENTIRDFSIYPNPASDMLFLDQVPEFQSAEWMDLSGRVLPVIKEGEYTLSLKNLNQGMYFLRIKAGDKILVKKIMKEK